MTALTPNQKSSSGELRFLILVLIPLTTSIANGLAFGIIAYSALHLATGKFNRKDELLYTFSVLFLVRFVYIGGS